MREECPVCGEQFQSVEGLHPYLDDTTLCCSARCADELDCALAACSEPVESVW
jgi:hypothetical protein